MHQALQLIQQVNKEPGTGPEGGIYRIFHKMFRDDQDCSRICFMLVSFVSLTSPPLPPHSISEQTPGSNVFSGNLRYENQH